LRWSIQKRVGVNSLRLSGRVKLLLKLCTDTLHAPADEPAAGGDGWVLFVIRHATTMVARGDAQHREGPIALPHHLRC
jgi:hypothetical protein